MNLYSSIFRRKSCRKYDLQPLPQEKLDEIENAIQGFAPLYHGMRPEYRFVKKLKGRFLVGAPHYLMFSGQGNEGEEENTGFLFEQLALWFDAAELGCVWLGASKDAEKSNSGKDLLAMGFGNVTDSVHRSQDRFKRRPIEEITNSPEDICIQAAHLAPSGINTQPWYFEKQGATTLVYKQRLHAPISLFYQHSNIDMGIALCHYALACKELEKPFSFSRTISLPKKQGYLPFGIIE